MFAISEEPNSALKAAQGTRFKSQMGHYKSKMHSKMRIHQDSDVSSHIHMKEVVLNDEDYSKGDEDSSYANDVDPSATRTMSMKDG